MARCLKLEFKVHCHLARFLTLQFKQPCHLARLTIKELSQKKAKSSGPCMLCTDSVMQSFSGPACHCCTVKRTSCRACTDSADQVLVQDVIKHNRPPKPTSCSTNIFRMIIEDPAGASCVCPWPWPWRRMSSRTARSAHLAMRQQVAYGLEGLVCRRSSPSSLRSCA